LHDSLVALNRQWDDFLRNTTLAVFVRSGAGV